MFNVANFWCYGIIALYMYSVAKRRLLKVYKSKSGDTDEKIFPLRNMYVREVHYMRLFYRTTHVDSEFLAL